MLMLITKKKADSKMVEKIARWYFWFKA